jgi:hypothetical protein
LEELIAYTMNDESTETWSLIRSAADAKNHDACPHPHGHALIGNKIQLPSAGPSFMVMIFSDSPIPLLSITLSISQPSLPNDPRIQAHWKRQLVGRVLAHSTNLTTNVVDYKDITFSIKSLSAPKTTRPSLFYMILPSTRITLQPTPTPTTTITMESSLPRPQPTTSSPVANLLMDTIYCVHKGVSVPRTFLLSGPPGVGKTYSIRLALENSSSTIQLISLRGSELLQQSNAAQALEFQFQKAAAAKPTEVVLIFLDECDALVSVDSIAAMLASLLDQTTSHWNRVLVVGATNRIDSIPDFLRRAGRFDREIPIAPPNALERAKILTTLLQQQQQDESAPSFETADIFRIAELCVGYVPADLTALARQAALLAMQQGGTTTADCLEQAMSDVGASALRDASLSAPPKITWKDIAGDPGGAKVRELLFVTLCPVWLFLLLTCVFSFSFLSVAIRTTDGLASSH